MTDAFLNVLEKVAPTAIAALLVTWFGVRLALYRYKREALWVRKLDAYTKILDALHVCRLNATHQREREEGGVARTQEYRDRMKQKVSDAYAELEKVVDAGALIVCPEATKYLREKMEAREDDWSSSIPIDFWSDEEKLMREALTEIGRIATKELQS